MDEARKLLGVKWRHRGRNARAVDCIGLLVVAARGAGFDIEDEGDYGREPWDDRLRRGCRRRFGEPVPTAEAGDVVVIRWGKAEPSHLAIVGDRPGGGLTLIHAHNLNGVVECTMAGKIAAGVVEIYRPRFG